MKKITCAADADVCYFCTSSPIVKEQLRYDGISQKNLLSYLCVTKNRRPDQGRTARSFASNASTSVRVNPWPSERIAPFFSRRARIGAEASTGLDFTTRETFRPVSFSTQAQTSLRSIAVQSLSPLTVPASTTNVSPTSSAASTLAFGAAAAVVTAGTFGAAATAARSATLPVVG